MTNSRWRALFSVFAIFAILAVAVACGDDDDTTKTTATVASSAAAGGSATTAPAAKASGTITLQMQQFEAWDPNYSDFGDDITQFYYVWRGLYHFDAKGLPAPAMAAGAPNISADGKTITVKLQAGLKWSDGSPLTSKDFALGALRTCNPTIAGNYEFILDTTLVGCHDYANSGKMTPAEQDALKAKVGVATPDDTTIVYSLIAPKPTFPDFLAMWPTFAVPSAKYNNDPGAKALGPTDTVYNGPFMVKDYTEKDHMTLVPNPNWKGKAVGVEKIVFRYIDDPVAALNAYKTGELDVITAPSTQLKAIKADPTLSKELVSYPYHQTIGLEPNVKAAPLDNPKVRLALALATDRKTFNDVVLQGANNPTTGWLPSDLPGGSPEGTYDSVIGFDAAKAKQTLADAGYPDGKGLPSITFLATDTAGNKLVGQFLQSEWKKYLNVDLKLEFTDSATRKSRYNKHDFQLVLGGWQEDYPDPENWMDGLFNTGGSLNAMQCSMPDIDALMDKARTNQNNTERLQQWSQVEKLVIDNACGMSPIYHGNLNFLVKPYLSGMIDHKSGLDHDAPGDRNPENWTTSKK
jgi:oligopeptide transport system substrate-binding protein